MTNSNVNNAIYLLSAYYVPDTILRSLPTFYFVSQLHKIAIISSFLVCLFVLFLGETKLKFGEVKQLTHAHVARDTAYQMPKHVLETSSYSISHLLKGGAWLKHSLWDCVLCISWCVV